MKNWGGSTRVRSTGARLPWGWTGLEPEWLEILSTLMLWVRILIRTRCTTLYDKVCQRLVTGQWFSTGPPVSSTNKTDRHDITEILLKKALSTIKQTNIQLNSYNYPKYNVRLQILKFLFSLRLDCRRNFLLYISSQISTRLTNGRIFLIGQHCLWLLCACCFQSYFNVFIQSLNLLPVQSSGRCSVPLLFLMTWWILHK